MALATPAPGGSRPRGKKPVVVTASGGGQGWLGGVTQHRCEGGPFQVWPRPRPLRGASLCRSSCASGLPWDVALLSRRRGWLMGNAHGVEVP